MLTRPFLIGLIALATLPSVPQYPASQLLVVEQLLEVSPLSADITRLIVTEQGVMGSVQRNLIVQLEGQYTGSGGKSLLSGMAIQVWVLRADGTASAQRDQRTYEKVGGDGSIDGVRFAFTPVPHKDLAGVVVSVNGTLFVREIKGHPAS